LTKNIIFTTILIIYIAIFDRNEYRIIMSKLTNAKKPAIIAKTQIHGTDTGSAEVQISVLTMEITNLTTHLKINPKDFSSRRGLLRKVGKRRDLLRYLSSVSQIRYKKVLAANKIKAL
jgi:small subunit ribosomal protein S15